MLEPKSHRNFFAGLLFTLVGGGFAIGATSYNVGESSRMGPGYFPLMVGVLLALLGASVIVKSFLVGPRNRDPVGRWAWRPLAHIIGANVVFGILLGGIPRFGIPAMGLIVAIYALVFIAARASGRRSLKELLLLATALAVGSYLTFVWGLQLQFPVWPSFIAG